MTVTLVEAIISLHEHLVKAELPHAFGGALALGWCTGDPRATNDLDVNVLIQPSDASRLLAALPAGITVDDSNLARLKRDGQDRLFWGRIPVDLFLSNTVRTHRKLRRAGVIADLNVYEGQSHAQYGANPDAPEYAATLRMVKSVEWMAAIERTPYMSHPTASVALTVVT